MIDFDGRRVDPEFSLGHFAAVLWRAKQDAPTSPEARQFMAKVATWCLAQAGGAQISGTDVALAILEVIWQRRGEAD